MKSSNIYAAIFVYLRWQPITAAHASTSSSRPIKIKNESGGKAEVYWVSPGDGQMVLQSPDMANGQELSLRKCMIHFWHDITSAHEMMM